MSTDGLWHCTDISYYSSADLHTDTHIGVYVDRCIVNILEIEEEY